MSRYCVGDSLPAVLTKTELAEALGYSVSQIDRYRRLKNHPGIRRLAGPGVRFDGRAVQEWIDGGRTAPVRRSFFNSTRRAS